MVEIKNERRKKINLYLKQLKVNCNLSFENTIYIASNPLSILRNLEVCRQKIKTSFSATNL
jgi:hypothetical protein